MNININIWYVLYGILLISHTIIGSERGHIRHNGHGAASAVQTVQHRRAPPQRQRRGTARISLFVGAIISIIIVSYVY